MTNEQIKAAYLPIISPWATQFSFDPIIACSIIGQESGGNPWATRMEPGWRYFYFAREYAERLGISVDTEMVSQAQSWGLMQVMGSVARELGFSSYLTKLISESLSIEYGCKKLGQLNTRYGGHESDVIAAYNAGSAIKTMGGHYKNQNYVNGVYGRLLQYRKLK